MPKEKSKEEKINIAEIGEFAQPKDGVETEELSNEEEREEIPEGEMPKEEVKTELTPEQIKEKIIHLISEVGSRGLSEEEKAKFIDDFNFWNGILFNALDIGDNLKGVIDRVHIQLTPTKAVLFYAIGTIGSIILLRPDLSKKIFGGKGKAPEVKSAEIKSTETTPMATMAEEEEEITEIPKEAPQPQI